MSLLEFHSVAEPAVPGESSAAHRRARFGGSELITMARVALMQH